jgi:cell division protein FtsW
LNIHRNSVYLLVVAVIGLVVLGMVMLSSTAAFVRDSGAHGTALVQKQATWLAFGCVTAAIAALLNYQRWRQTWWVWFGLSVVLLALCFVKPIGVVRNGAARWLDIGGMSLQPSELAKLAAVIALAWWFAREKEATGTFLKGFFYPLCGVGVLMALIVLEVDLGTTALIGCVSLTLMFVAGTRWRYLVPIVPLGVAALFAIIKFMPERSGRILAFLHPELYPDDAYQQVQGLIALGSGGVEGLGLGLGRQKIEYLPYAHTDFIFPVIGEELGLRFTLLVVLAFLCIAISGTIIAMRARDRFGMLLGYGIVLLISIQACVNIGVTTMVLPNKGMPLPFISSGGSNLVFCLTCVGILISIWRSGVGDKEAKANIRLQAKTIRRPMRL